MAETVSLERVYDELKTLQEEVSYIKKHMIDPDMIMTDDEEIEYKKAMEELKQGKTTSLSDMKKELGL